MPVIKTAGLSKTYKGDIHALADLDLSVESGEVLGLLGPNGAGKTTTVRLLNGTLEPTNGEIEIFGRSATDVATRQKTATLAEMAKLYDHLSPTKNLEFFAAMYNANPEHLDSKIRDLLERMGLSGREHDKVGTFSTGMKKRVQLARTLLHDPELVFLDEPTSGLDPDAARQVTELIRNLAQDAGTTVILCTHNLPLAETVCDTFGFLANGKLVAYGTKESLAAEFEEQITIEVTTKTRSESITIENEDEINSHLMRIIKSGEQIREVRLNDPDLESLYFKYVGRSVHELG